MSVPHNPSLVPTKVSILDPSDIHNVSVPHNPLLVAIKVSVLGAVENSVACVHLDRGPIFDGCQAK